jgi:hypothetical protein
VKVRGFRIELGEVEGAIAQHPAVKQVVVTARDYGDADRRLIAYVVGGDGRPPPAQLRAFVKERLPEYMVPSVFLFLDKLPLTPSGKVDRQALPAPERIAGAEREHVAARGPTEEALVGIFAEVLKIPAERSACTTASSSSAVTRSSRHRPSRASAAPSASSCRCAPLRGADAGGARQARRRGAARRQDAALPPLEREQAGPERPLSFAQERLWFLDQLTPG